MDLESLMISKCFIDELEENGTIYQRELIQLNNYPDLCWIYLLMKEDALFPEPPNKFRIHAKKNWHSHKIMSWEFDNHIG